MIRTRVFGDYERQERIAIAQQDFRAFRAARAERHEAERLKEANYNPSVWMIGRWYLKMGKLTVYVYRKGIGFSWNCGRSYELTTL